MGQWVQIATALLIVGLCGARPAAAQTVTYNPGLGSLPEAQGFTLFADGSANAPSVSGGILRQGPNPDLAYQYWARTDIPVDFDQGFVLTANLKVLSSGYESNAGSPGIQRAGYYFNAADSQKRRFAIGIASNGFYMTNDAEQMVGNGLAFTNFDTTDAFHEYQLVVGGGVGRLIVDGIERGSVAIGSEVGEAVPNSVSFGDASSWRGSQTELAAFSYTAQTSSAVPEPGAVLLFLPAVALLVLQRRRIGAPASG